MTCKINGVLLSVVLALAVAAAVCGCSKNDVQSQQPSAVAETQNTEINNEIKDETVYDRVLVPLERNGVELHLECIKVKDTDPEKN
ncbi:MAG: hypothetical protein IJ736_03535, partial [Firmicutes bacterium]|nr:hypothetical protein [Bacillota bacterium]